MHRSPMARNPESDTAYISRMRLILRWRRIAHLACLLIGLYAVGWLLLEPNILQSPHLMTVGSLFAFAVAIVVAVNALSFLLR